MATDRRHDEKLLEQRRIAVGKYNADQDTFTLNLWVERAKSSQLNSGGSRPTTRALTEQAFSTLCWEIATLSGSPNGLCSEGLHRGYVVRDRPNALIVDAFAGSGTTVHATCLLNAEDGGDRRAVVISNNEVDDNTAKVLRKKGISIGDEEYDKEGIFFRATKPRVEAAITGKRSDGTALKGQYIGARSLALGFTENASFFRVDYLDPDSIEVGRQLEFDPARTLAGRRWNR